MLARLQLENDKSVGASAVANTKDVDLLPCRRFNLIVVPNTTHTFGVKVNWASDILTGDGKVQEAVIASASQGNIVSAIVDCKADIASFEIANGDTAAHTYDVYVNRIE